MLKRRANQHEAAPSQQEPRRGSDGAHPRSVADKSKRAAPREPTLARGFFLSEQTKAGSSLALPLQRV
jgi:hypothetical protein